VESRLGKSGSSRPLFRPADERATEKIPSEKPATQTPPTEKPAAEQPAHDKEPERDTIVIPPIAPKQDAAAVVNSKESGKKEKKNKANRGPPKEDRSSFLKQKLQADSSNKELRKEMIAPSSPRANNATEAPYTTQSSQFYASQVNLGSQASFVVPVQKGKYFGVPLAQVEKINGIPVPLEQCIVHLEKHGLQEEGILRIGGNSNDVKRLKQEFDLGNNPDVSACNDIHTVGSVLKQYLRELPSPLIKSSRTNDDEPDINVVLKQLKEILLELPQENYVVTKRLSGFLREVVRHSDVNLMSVENIGIVFSPTLRLTGKLIGYLIVHYNSLFDIQE